MKALDHIRLVWDYNYWAQHKLLDCLETVSNEDFLKPVPYSIGSLREQSAHTMWAEALWLYHRIQGQARIEWTAQDYPDVPAIRQRWTQVENDWRTYLEQLTDSDLSRVIEMKRLDGQTHHHSLSEILLHVPNHGTDHRSQMLRIIHDFGGKTFEQDMIYYFRELNAEGKNV